MKDTVVACVRTGKLYPFEYVVKLRNMVARHLREPYTMVCLTDQPERCDGVAFIDVSAIGLNGWWAKMILFEPMWRDMAKVIYFDLDTVIIRDIGLLTKVPGEFSICANFNLLTNPYHPCKYNSSVMVIGSGMGNFIWHEFERRRDLLRMTHANSGEQACIEEIYPSAQLLQNMLPKDFLCNYSQLTDRPPRAPTAVIVFGGNARPRNCGPAWVKEAWS